MGNFMTFNKREYVEPQCQCEKPMTNADRIRNMTNEELADLLQEAEDCGYRDASITPIKDGGYMDMLEWLQAEVEEGNSNENT